MNVVQEGGALRNGNEGILGADNKAAVATMLGAARRLVAEGSPVGVELLFTTCEERALDGAKAVDTERLRSEYGFVFDHASPIGELVVASPTYYRLEARFLGHAAHAGIRPEAGRNAIAAAARAIAAMPNGRLDPETTANVGADRGRHGGERGGRALRGRAGGAQPRRGPRRRGGAGHGRRGHRGGRLRRMRRGDRGRAPVPRLPAAAHRAGGGGGGGRAPEPRARAPYISTGGGSDANVFVAAGLPVVNVANGTERNHQPDESVTVEALEQMLDVTLAIVAAGAG